MRLRDLSFAVSRAGLCEMPLSQACAALAAMPEAARYTVTPALLYRALRYVLPEEQAVRLLDESGVRGRLRLADLAHLAQYDAVLRQVVAAIICLVDRGE